MRPLLNVSSLAVVTALVVALGPAAIEGQQPDGSMGANPGSPPQLQPFFGVGLAMGTGNLGTNTDAGWMAFGGFDVPLGASGVSLGVTGSHARMGYQGGFDEAAQVSMVTGDIGYAYTGLSPRAVTPFLRAGVGMRVERYEPGRLAAASSTETGIGASASGGLAFAVGRTTLLLGAHFMTGRNAGYWGAQGGIAIPVSY